MVPRYARPAMSAIWEPEARYRIWFEIEAHATEKLGALGVVPESAARALWDWWKTDPVRTIRTKKVPRNHVKAEATEKHPAQVEVYYEDIPVGYWTTVKFSGALPARRVNELVDRVEKLQHAVKFAREEANNMEITDQRVGGVVFDYLFR